ncbi:ATP-dependent RNA helicase DBP8 [Kwoniella shivajii]|uniref:ATP-dependent RNA helicase DBP8 n=1 Tax=Kwoniella shivajii TaxID=564305 RepID=A0ABZ1CX79_9TREE|nr:ATP-dependent RNA helicase DBP8 [Kwoniella shivajii]
MASNKLAKKFSHRQEAESVLDQNDVMKAMMAAQKGKGKEIPSGEDDDSDSDSGSGHEDNDHEEEITSDDSDSHSVNGESSSGDISTRKGIKRNRAFQSDDSDEEDIDAPRQAQNATSTSRVNLPSRTFNSMDSRAALLQPKADTSSIFTTNPKPPSDSTFASLGLSQPLITALASINILKPTEIQSACVGPILSGKDCIGGAKTGSGKTMAFALPIVERIARDPFGVWAVVLTPTRELAYQLSEQFLVVGKPLGLTTATIVGGMDMMTQAQQLQSRPHIIVATPGRLCDLLRSGGSQNTLSRVRTLVLDEADRLLTPTFAPELAYLFSQIPPKRQTCLFTATVSEAIMELANKPPALGKDKPFVYRVESDTLTVSRLKQKYLFIPSQIRDSYLLYLLQNPPQDIDIALRAAPKKAKRKEAESYRHKKGRKPQRKAEEEEGESNNIPSTVIFTQRCATAHLLHLLLNQLEIPSVPLHSHLTQPQRLLSLARFRAQEVPVLVTTDVGSRGLDIPEVAMVINWDCPRRSDDYVHRVGRTARAGRGGVAVTVITERDVDLIKIIEDDIKVKLEELELPEEEVLEALNRVSLARRMATMEMHDSGFGERQAINKAKAIKRMKRDAVAKAA